METCSRCRQRWFNMDLPDGVCSNCRKADRGQGQAVWLFSALNNMQPDEMPPMLPELTQVEEILILRVHVFLEVRLIRGQQYRYQGHVVHFLRDIGRVYDELPLLPTDLLIKLMSSKWHRDF